MSRTKIIPQEPRNKALIKSREIRTITLSIPGLRYRSYKVEEKRTTDVSGIPSTNFTRSIGKWTKKMINWGTIKKAITAGGKFIIDILVN